MEMDNNHQIVADTVNTEETSTVNFVEEMVGEVIVPSSSQSEDTIPLVNSRVVNNFENCATIDNEGPSISGTNQTDLETSGRTSNDSSGTRRLAHVIRIITQNVSREDRVGRRYVDLKYEIIKRRLNLLKLKREGLVKQFDLRMKLLRTRLFFEKKKLHMFRKKYRC